MSYTKLVAVALVLTAPGVSYAGDASWLWCRGIADHGAGTDHEKSYVAVSAVEHRSAKGDDRELTIAFMKGSNESHGQTSSETGKQALKLTSISGKKRLVFTGTSELAQDLATITLTGKIDWSFGYDAKPTMQPFAVKLTCETLDDLSIGH